MTEMYDNPLIPLEERLEIAIGSARFWRECYEQKVRQLQEADKRISDLMWQVYPDRMGS